MKIYKAAIIGLGPSGLAVKKLIYDNSNDEIIAFENSDFEKRDNLFGFWLNDWMRPFNMLIEKKWNCWKISNEKKEILHKDNHHPYCVINYKSWRNYCLSSLDSLIIKNKKVINYCSVGDCYKILTEDNKEYFAEKIYDSRYKKEKNNELIQHFYGINIIADENSFNENQMTLMHFTKEKDLLHFIYILPFSHNKALVESTVFSKVTQSEDWYRKKIYQYLESIKIKNFREEGVEKGVIPMFFIEEKSNYNKNIFNIGVRGGACKASTGYAFSFLIKQIQLLKESNKSIVNVHRYLDKKMDKVFLNYLKNNNENGDSFINLAKNLNGNEFQSFMMGTSNIITKLKIIKSMPKFKFFKALIN